MTDKTPAGRGAFGKLCRVGVALALTLASGIAAAAATIVITNGNAAGVGFNDPTPVAPVGGNTGTTLGQQRLNAFGFAANIWGATLNSSVTINILATFTPLTCTATGAVLGSAGATAVFRDFTTAPIIGAWYPAALANKLMSTDLLSGAAQIRANFNSNLGNPGCLTGSAFYLGFDNLFGTGIDLVTVLLHEFGHGLGFQTFTSGSSGAFFSGFPSVWDFSLLDITTNKTWDQMSNAERVASAIKTQKLVWTGAGVTASVPLVLQAGTPELVVTGPSSVAGSYIVGTASFGPALSSPGVTGQIMPVVDQADGVTGLACTALNAKNALAVNGRIALVDRGVCGFAVKAAVVQAAGAIGMVVADNVAGSPPPGLGGADPTITIPSVRITQADGAKLKAGLAFRSRNSSGVIGKLDLNPAVRAGADASNRALMYTPNPFISGSSVSHWDTSAFPNQLMEPNINADLLHVVTVPTDLTYRLLQDIGW